MGTDSTQVIEMQGFQEKLKERLQKDIGELIPDAALQQLVEKAVQSSFFEKTKIVDTRGYNNSVREEPSWFEAEVGKLLKTAMQKQVETYFAENNDLLLQRISDTIVENAPKMMAEIILTMFNGGTTKIVGSFQQALVQQLQSKGLQIY